MIPTASLTPLLTRFEQWAALRDEVVAAALLGSYARGEARPDSDVDLLVLTTDPLAFRRDTQWAQEISWERVGADVASWADEDYGALWSRRITLHSGLEIEVGFAAPTWAAIDPVDAGTRTVVEGGIRILLDPAGLLDRLLRAVYLR